MKTLPIETKMAQVLNSYRAEGRSWTWLSRKFGIPESTLQTIATQKNSPTIHTAMTFWAALGMKIDVVPLEIGEK